MPGQRVARVNPEYHNRLNRAKSKPNVVGANVVHVAHSIQLQCGSRTESAIVTWMCWMYIPSARDCIFVHIRAGGPLHRLELSSDGFGKFSVVRSPFDACYLGLYKT
jgi:hypothetical protein